MKLHVWRCQKIGLQNQMERTSRKGWGGVGKAIIRGVDEYKGFRVWKTETARHQIII